MRKFRFLISFFVAGIIVFSLIAGSQAYHDNTNDEHEKVFPTDKTDRTLIKEIYANQQETLKLLREIRGIVKASKDN